MKKIFALMLALMMMLCGVSALAEAKTFTVKATVDQEALQNTLSLFGAPSDTANQINAVVALLNALGFKVVVADNAAQLDLDVNGQQLLSVGGAMNESGLAIASNLFPSYLLTVSQETIEQMMQQIMAQMPGAGQNFNMEALMGKLMAPVSEFIGTVQTAVTPGEAEAVTFEVEGYTFDTKTPMNVDVNAIAEAEKKLVSDLLSDESLVEMLNAFGRGQKIDPAQIIAQNNEAMSEEHLPNVTVDVYTSTADGSIFYAESLATYKDKTDPSYRFTMLNKGQSEGTIVFYVLDQDLAISITYSANGFALEVTGNGAYFGLKASWETWGSNNANVVLEVYFMDPAKALLKVEISITDGGEITLAMDPATQTVLSIEDIQNNKVDESVQQGFMSELQTNGMPMITTIMMAVPEASSLLQLMN